MPRAVLDSFLWPAEIALSATFKAANDPAAAAAATRALLRAFAMRIRGAESHTEVYDALCDIRAGDCGRTLAARLVASLNQQLCSDCIRAERAGATVGVAAYWKYFVKN